MTLPPPSPPLNLTADMPPTPRAQNKTTSVISAAAINLVPPPKAVGVKEGAETADAAVADGSSVDGRRAAGGESSEDYLGELREEMEPDSPLTKKRVAERAAATAATAAAATAAKAAAVMKVAATLAASGGGPVRTKVVAKDVVVATPTIDTTERPVAVTRPIIVSSLPMVPLPSVGNMTQSLGQDIESVGVTTPRPPTNESAVAAVPTAVATAAPTTTLPPLIVPVGNDGSFDKEEIRFRNAAHHLHNLKVEAPVFVQNNNLSYTVKPSAPKAPPCPGNGCADHTRSPVVPTPPVATAVAATGSNRAPDGETKLKGKLVAVEPEETNSRPRLAPAENVASPPMQPAAQRGSISAASGSASGSGSSSSSSSPSTVSVSGSGSDSSAPGSGSSALVDHGSSGSGSRVVSSASAASGSGSPALGAPISLDAPAAPAAPAPKMPLVVTYERKIPTAKTDGALQLVQPTVANVTTVSPATAKMLTTDHAGNEVFKPTTPKPEVVDQQTSRGALAAFAASVRGAAKHEHVGIVDPGKLAVMADVGSSGVRLLIYVKSEKGETVECCGAGTPCAKECDDHTGGCAKIDQIPIHSHYDITTTKAEVVKFVGLLVNASYHKIETTNIPECTPYLGTNFTSFRDTLAKANIALLATGGARRIEIEAAHQGIKSPYETVFKAGFQKYFGPVSKVKGSVLPG